MSSEIRLNSNPKSRFSESIKTIRTNLAFSSIGKDLKVILMTSPEAGDGKSYISANLAVAYAQEGKRVLLIDADLRKGRQHEIFDVLNSVNAGYSNLILNYKDGMKLGKYILPTANENVELIPTGTTPPNPIELLASENNAKFIERVKEEYDIIILDCTPVIGLSDALVMTRFSDVNIAVVSCKKTKFENLDRVKKVFEQSNIKLGGVVVNKVQTKENRYYSYYTNDYYYKDNKRK